MEASGYFRFDDRSLSQLLSEGGERAHIGVARVQRDVGKECTAGAFFSQ